MKLKRVTPEQYRTLAALGMPLYASSHPCLDEDGEYNGGMIRYMTTPQGAAYETEHAVHFSDVYDYLYTLVDENEYEDQTDL